jgi:hypothetical protein
MPARGGIGAILQASAIGASRIAQFVETIGRGCIDGLGDVFCARIGGGILVHRFEITSRIVGVSQRSKPVSPAIAFLPLTRKMATGSGIFQNAAYLIAVRVPRDIEQ